MMARAWFSITALERKVLLLIAGLLILGSLVRLCRNRSRENAVVLPVRAAETR